MTYILIAIGKLLESKKSKNPLGRKMDEKQNAVKCLIDHLYEINYDCCFLVFLGVSAKFRRRGRPSFPYDINGIGKGTGKSNYRHTAASSKQQVGLWDLFKQ